MVSCSWDKCKTSTANGQIVWDIRDQRVKASLITSIRDNQIHLVTSAKTAKEVWDKLATIFETKDITSNIFATIQMMYFDHKEATMRYCIYCVFSFALENIRRIIKQIIMGKQITVNRKGQYKKAYTSVMISNCINIMLHGRYRLNVKQNFYAFHNNMSWHIQMLEIGKNPNLTNVIKGAIPPPGQL